ncbi:phage head closure protein [Burkholderia vietnamiensis]|uniref:phage head closure protein n=1 Tax=Burkholderia vietnamiensis TaxID=60552 RepID=UPI0009BEE095|nr:phage head closure protein [Burkholderia vietnamiensis]
MLAGDLSLKISLQRKSSGQDELGQPVDVWTEYALVWGSVRQLTGKEKVAGGTQVDTGTASIRIRYRTDVNNGDRAIAQGHTFNIASVLPNVATREFTDLACTENANAG